jgi:hypothetical protein
MKKIQATYNEAQGLFCIDEKRVLYMLFMLLRSEHSNFFNRCSKVP